MPTPSLPDQDLWAVVWRKDPHSAVWGTYVDDDNRPLLLTADRLAEEHIDVTVADVATAEAVLSPGAPDYPRLEQRVAVAEPVVREWLGW